MHLFRVMFAAGVCVSVALGQNLLLMTGREAESLKRAASQLRPSANTALARGPWSVTYHRPPNSALSPHDFVSEGPYWWPDPKNPSGPYIRKDGETNPDRFVANDRDLNEMSDAVAILGAAAYATGDQRYTKRVAEVLRVWFVDEKTRMAPHMRYGQGVRGRNDGRAAGLIESRPFIWLIQGVQLAQRAPGWDQSLDRPLREWFAGYMRWFTTHAHGIQEAKSGNNHSTWWAAQVGAFAIFAGEEAQQAKIWQSYRDYLLPSQFEAAGNAPREDARTRSLGYSAMNLDAFTLICRMAQMRGVDLWSYRTPDRFSIRNAIDYLAPFVQNPGTWTKPQITRYDASRNFFLALAGLGFGEPKYIAMQKRLGLTGGAPASILNAMINAPLEEQRER